jgi:hypothetical protein
MSDYRVGQILYMIGEKTTKVVPIQVVEEIIRTTMDGKAKSYIIKLPDKAKTTADISEIKGKLFDNTSSLREYMTKNATAAIDKMINNATNLRDSVFEYTIQNREEKSSLATEAIGPDQLSMFPTLSEHVESIKFEESERVDGTIQVDLGGGNFAKMKTEDLEKLRS